MATTTSIFIDSMLAEFAQFIVATHKKFVETKRLDAGNDKMELCEKSSTSNFRTFLLYELYKIGVSRKIITGTTEEPKLVLLYVRRNSPFGKSDNLIVKLCRSLYFDLENMLIVSSGDYKCLSLAEFSRLTSGKVSHVQLKSDGCQIIYNPGLQVTYGNDSLLSAQNEDDPMTANNSSSSTTDKISREVKDFTYATRTILGAETKFNPTAKTFKEIFTSTCDELNIDLTEISDKYKTNHSLVFNVLTIDSATLKSQNITSAVRLCRVFQYLSIADMSAAWSAVKQSIDDINATDSEYEKLYDTIVFQIANGIKELDPVKSIIDSGLKNVELAYSFVNEHNIPMNDMYESMQDVIDSYYNSIDARERKPHLCVALFLIGENGEKTKIVVPAYQYYYDLKGDRSIDITPENSYNLFHTYWRLLKTNKLPEFIAVFDNPMNHTASSTATVTTASEYCTYVQIFKWFASIIEKFAASVFNSYKQVYIYKNKTISAVPFAEKPLVAELYSEYNTKRSEGQKVFTSVDNARNIIFNHDSHYIAWRLSPTHVKVIEERFVSNKPASSTSNQ